MNMHKSITQDRVMRLAQSQMFGLDDPGICVACGEEASGVEPDARKYECEACGKRAVYGAQELLFHLIP
jgi:predicted RNA-binding Zn-ribbon protein involved in translation (DUF1610 family)